MLPTEETKEQFMERYAAYSQRPDVFEKDMIALPCDCEEGGGPTHWAALGRAYTGLIRHHLDFHAPEGTPWPEGVPERTVDESDVSLEGVSIIYQENMG